jgi:hypothetical protein
MQHMVLSRRKFFNSFIVKINNKQQINCKLEIKFRNIWRIIFLVSFNADMLLSLIIHTESNPFPDQFAENLEKIKEFISQSKNSLKIALVTVCSSNCSADNFSSVWWYYSSSRKKHRSLPRQF